MKPISFIFFFFLFPYIFCSAQYLYTIDSLFKLDYRGSETKIFYLANSLKNYRVNAELEIEWFKRQEFVFNKEKRMNKMTLCYEKATVDVDKYLNEFSFYLKNDDRKRKDYLKCNKDFKKALISMRKLYKGFLDEKHYDERHSRRLNIFYLKPVTINKAVKCTLKWESDFNLGKKLNSEELITVLKRGYFYSLNE